jgi:hypothetical protein
MKYRDSPGVSFKDFNYLFLFCLINVVKLVINLERGKNLRPVTPRKAHVEGSKGGQ